MARHGRWLATVAAALAGSLLVCAGWPERAREQGTASRAARPPAMARISDRPAPLRDPDQRALDDPLLSPGLIYTLEEWLAAAGGAEDPFLSRQGLAGLTGSHFPADLGTRALALAERYLDYRVALARMPGPRNPASAHELRSALQARQSLRLQFFDAAEYAALFHREDELNRHTLARMEAARHSEWTAAQRAQALQAADDLLPAQRLMERKAAVEHLAAASQTAGFDARAADIHERHAARSAQYGETAAHALAALDRQEQDWQRRLNLYRQASAQGLGDGALQALRTQLFSTQELLRVDAALALQAAGAATADGG